MEKRDDPMLKRPITACIAALLPLSVAQAETVNDCLSATFEVAKAAQTKTARPDQMTELEELITKIEELCEAKKFADAKTSRDQLRNKIAGM